MVELPGIVGGAVGGMMPKMMAMVKYGGIIFILVIAAVLIFKFVFPLLDFKIKTKIYLETSDGVIEKKDRGAIIYHKGMRVFKFLKSKPKVQPMPPDKAFYNKGKAVDWIKKEGMFTPVLKKKISVEGNPGANVELVTKRQQMLMPWNVCVKNEVDRRFDIRDFWDKYGNIVSIAVVGGICIVVIALYFQSGQMNTAAVIDALTKGFDKLAAGGSSIVKETGGSAPW